MEVVGQLWGYDFSSFQIFYCIPFSCKTGAAKQLTSVDVNGAPQFLYKIGPILFTRSLKKAL